MVSGYSVDEDSNSPIDEISGNINNNKMIDIITNVINNAGVYIMQNILIVGGGMSAWEKKEK